MAPGSGLAHAFVAPSLGGPATGGTLYNAGLIAALQRAGLSCGHFELAALPVRLSDAADVLWIDSLHLESMPELRRRAGDARLHLLLHYLPSLVRRTSEATPHALDAAERAALELADVVLVTSPFMRDLLERGQHASCPVLCVEPGVELVAAAPRATDAGPLRGAMLCSVVEAKGVLPLLAALAAGARADDRFELAIAGRVDLEPDYARACSALTTQRALCDRVRLLGPLAHPQALELLCASEVLLSASRMESYGMALAEARAAGVPILARAGGHAAAHVDRAAGGLLARDESAVAADFLALARAPALRQELRRRAQAQRRSRSWTQAASELTAQLAALG